MRQLARYAARLAAGVLVLAIMIGPVVAVAAVAGNPFPADLFSRVSGRNVDDATIIKLLSLLFYACWAWFCLPALRQLVPTRRSHARPRSAPGRAGTAAAPATQPKVTGPTHGPRGALARLARFAVSSVAVVTTLTGAPGVAHTSPGADPAAVVTVVGAPTDSADFVASAPATVDDAATTIVAQHRDTPYAIAHRHFAADQVGSAREEILALNVGRPLPDGATYRGGGFPAGWDVIVPAAASAAVTAPPPTAEPVIYAGHVVTDGESYWSISEAQLPGELGREPTDRQVYERTEAAIAYNAPRLGYDDPKMLRTGDIVYVDPATLLSAAVADAAVEGGHVVADGESYWSISEAELSGELGREPTDREVYERTEAAIAYNAPRLGYDDPQMLHPGDIVYVDAATLSVAATPSIPVPPVVELVVEPVVPAVTSAHPDEATAPVPLPVPTAAPDDGAADPMPVAPSTTLTPAELTGAGPPPVTATPHVTEEVSVVDQEDMLSSRWLFGGIAVTSLGLVGAWTTVKQMRRRRRRWLGLQTSHEVLTAPTAREHAAQLDVAMLRQFVDPARLASNGACAVVLGDRPEIRFRVPPPPPPGGWELTDDAWRRNTAEPLAAAPVLSPALVTIGYDPDDSVSAVILDLLSAGSVSVTGDRVAVDRLMCSMLWELASAPLGEMVELHIVGLACAAARHATSAGRLVSLDEAIATAQTPQPTSPQVFLVDPFADEPANGSLRELVEACPPGSGRAVVVAGPCEHPVEEISVPSEHRAIWDDLTLVPPQLPESIDVELGRMLDSIEVGRRPVSVVTLALTPDPEAEALALRSTLKLDDDAAAFPGDEDDEDDAGGRPPVAGDLPEEEPVDVDDVVDVPTVVLSVCGREVAVRGYPVPQAAAVLFVLAAAGRGLPASELAEQTGYAVKSLSTVFTANHELIERDHGTLRLADHVWTDHAWATRCVTQLADAMQVDAESLDTTRWMLAALEALQALEQGPFAVLPAARAGRARSGATPWGWIDDFPEDTPARSSAETEVAEAALAFSELWLAAPGTHHRVVRPDQLVAELCRLAATVPFAHVVRQLRESMWVSGAECLLSAAARVAGDDETLLGRVHQTARALAAREQLEASNALADELGL